MDERTARRVAQLIAGLLVSDDDLAQRESHLFEKMLERLGLDPSVRESLFPVIDPTEAAQAFGRLPAGARHEALSLLIDAAVADGKIVESERRYLSSVARAAGVSEADLERKISEKLG